MQYFRSNFIPREICFLAIMVWAGTNKLERRTYQNDYLDYLRFSCEE